MSERRASLQRGHNLGRLVVVGRRGLGSRFGSRVGGRLNLNAVVRSTFESAVGRMSSKSESSACDISGLIEAKVLERSSVPYRCFTRPGKSGCMRQVSMTILSRIGDISSPWCVMKRLANNRLNCLLQRT